MACKHSDVGRPALAWVRDSAGESAHAAGAVAQRMERGIGGLLNPQPSAVPQD